MKSSYKTLCQTEKENKSSRPSAPVRLNCRVHMHFPEAVHLGQSDASQLVSVQLLERKISLWLIRQSCSDVQLTELLMQAPSGQLVHHLHCRAGWRTEEAGFSSE